MRWLSDRNALLVQNAHSFASKCRTCARACAHVYVYIAVSPMLPRCLPVCASAHLHISISASVNRARFPARLRTGKPAHLPASGHKRSCPPPESAKLRDFFARRNALAFSALRPFQEKFPKISPKFLRQKFGVCAKSPYLCTRKSEMRPTTPHKSEAIRSLKTLHKTIL